MKQREPGSEIVLAFSRVFIANTSSSETASSVLAARHPHVHGSGGDEAAQQRDPLGAEPRRAPRRHLGLARLALLLRGLGGGDGADDHALHLLAGEAGVADGVEGLSDVLPLGVVEGVRAAGVLPDEVGHVDHLVFVDADVPRRVLRLVCLHRREARERLLALAHVPKLQ
eukprot:CAMPEP_0174854246 /NCGR_PEP_ID=MMETSP1114-20130205/30523_1 /TAXON_ID=312471 /ORGANISM="Neobodo designis, Strain CCAP 1951/1" /LENGTH=169 /DNA_ID=CAMNT_0016088929 /DNA_START=70 /DNA_END=579 /DNA_ORIENTATION=-